MKNFVKFFLIILFAVCYVHSQDKISEQLELEKILAEKVEKMVRSITGVENFEVAVSLNIEKRVEIEDAWGGGKKWQELPGYNIKRIKVVLYMPQNIVSEKKEIEEIKNSIKNYLELRKVDEIEIFPLKKKKSSAYIPFLKFPYLYVTVTVLLFFLFIVFMGKFSGAVSRSAGEISGLGSEFIDVFKKKNFAGESGGGLISSLEKGGISPNPAAVSPNGEERQKKPFAYVFEDDMDNLLHLIKKQNDPHKAAIIINYLDPSVSSRLYSMLERKMQEEIILYLSQAREADMSEVLNLNEEIKTSLSYLIGGEKKVLDLFAYLDENKRKTILDDLKGKSPKTAENLEKKIVTFENILNLESRSLRLVFRALSHMEFIRLLTSLPEKIRVQIFSIYPETMVETLKDEVQYAQPFPSRMLEREKVKLADIVRQLEREGLIEMKK